MTCKGNKEVRRKRFMTLISSNLFVSGTSIALACIWPWFNLRLAWAWSGTSLGPDPNILTHICHSRLGEEAMLSEA